MARKFSKADIQAYRADFDGAVSDRIAKERAGFDAFDADKQRIVDAKCVKIKNYANKVCDDYSMTMLANSGVPHDFINTPNMSNIYTAKKVCEFAACLAGIHKLNEYDEIAFRCLYKAHGIGEGVTRNDVKSGVCHTHEADNFGRVWRMKGFHKDSSTANAQQGSSLACMLFFGIAKREHKHGQEYFVLDVNAYATKAIMRKLGLAS